MSRQSLTDQCNAVLAQRVTLEDLIRQYPDDWQTVKEQTTALIKDGSPALINSHIQKTKAVQDHWVQKIRDARAEPRVAREGLKHLVRTRMTMLSVDRQLRAALARPKTAGDQPRRIDTWIADKLCFNRSRQRRTVRARTFRFWWSRLRGRGAILSGLQHLGLYAIYTKDLAQALTHIVGGRRCIEVAAGDGTLTRTLGEAGLTVRASDDQTWGDKLRYPSWVEACSAEGALAREAPQAVICSWPPPGNQFEARIFATPSVELYIVVGSRHRFACGNWDTYDRQTTFDWAIDERLSALVMPPELDAAVLVFRRRV